MDQETAIAIAKKISEERGWDWKDPAKARRSRFNFLSKPRWEVVSNFENRGCNVRVTIEEGSGKILQAGFIPR